MYKIICVSIIILFSNWKVVKNENPKKLVNKQTIEVFQNHKKFKFVIAESGLNYRNSPNGKILGKFK